MKISKLWWKGKKLHTVDENNKEWIFENAHISNYGQDYDPNSSVKVSKVTFLSGKELDLSIPKTPLFPGQIILGKVEDFKILTPEEVENLKSFHVVEHEPLSSYTASYEITGTMEMTNDFNKVVKYLTEEEKDE